MNINVSIKRMNLWVSKRCNLRCRMCDYGVKDSGRKELTFGQLEQLMRDAVDLGLENLDLSGGEPMMRKDIYDIIALAGSFGVRTQLITNGTLIGEKEAERLAASGINAVVISLEGFEDTNDMVRGKGSYRKAVDAIHNLRKYRDRLDYISVGITISKANYKEFYPFTKYLIEGVGVDTISYNPFNKEMLLHESFEAVKDTFTVTPDILEDLRGELEKVIAYSNTLKTKLSPDYYLRKIPDYFEDKKMLPDFPCCEPLTGCSVNSTGQVFGCWGEQETAVGDLTRASLKDIVKSEAYIKACKRALTLKCTGCLRACHVGIHETQF